MFSGVPKDGTLHVLPQYLEAYSTAEQWCEFTNIKGDLTEGGIKGDINGDESTDGNDVSILLEMVLAGGVTEEQLPLADINDDGSADGNDVSILLEMVLSGE